MALRIYESPRTFTEVEVDVDIVFGLTSFNKIKEQKDSLTLLDRLAFSSNFATVYSYDADVAKEIAKQNSEFAIQEF